MSWDVLMNCDDLSWQSLDSDSWSIEFNVGENTETEWKAYRDKIVNNQ